MFVGKVGHENWPLCEEDQAGGSFIDRLLMAAQELSRHVRLNSLEADMVAHRVVQGERHEIHMHHAGEPLNEISKKFV